MEAAAFECWGKGERYGTRGGYLRACVCVLVTGLTSGGSGLASNDGVFNLNVYFSPVNANAPEPWRNVVRVAILLGLVVALVGHGYRT